jgi:hypothetical protein
VLPAILIELPTLLKVGSSFKKVLPTVFRVRPAFKKVLPAFRRGHPLLEID